jgi:hypothetical protein
VCKIETLLQALHSYFTSSPKRHLEFTKLAELVETSGLKILGSVRTRWINMLEPLKRVLSEYKTLIVKMSKDATEESKAAHNLMLLCDVSTLLALPSLLPLLESVNSLITFSQSRNVFVSDYVAAIKICQAELYEMYVDSTSSFMGGKFQLLNDILADHSCTISQEWQVDLNDCSESLDFGMVGHTYATHSKEWGPRVKSFGCPGRTSRQ